MKAFVYFFILDDNGKFTKVKADSVTIEKDSGKINFGFFDTGDEETYILKFDLGEE